MRIRLLRPAPRGLRRARRGTRSRRRARRRPWPRRRRTGSPSRDGRRRRGVRQPEERDVVEDVVTRETSGAVRRTPRDQLQAALVVVDHEGRQTDRGIRQCEKGLRARPHDQGVRHVVVDVVQLLAGVASPRPTTGTAADCRTGSARQISGGTARPCSCGCRGVQAAACSAHEVRDDRAPVAALRDEAACTRDAASAPSRRARCVRGPSPASVGLPENP